MLAYNYYIYTTISNKLKMNIKSKSTLEKFENKLRFRNYSDQTVKTYINYAEKFLSSFSKDIYHIPLKDAEQYLMKYKYSSISQQSQIISAVKSLYINVVGRNLGSFKITRPRKEKKLPKVIDRDFLIDRISNIKNIKHKAILSLGYSVGLRVSEVVNLKISDIDSNRMIITINAAKGKKDRIVPLSPNILNLLRDYFKDYKPVEYLFNGQTNIQYTATSCNKIVKKYLGAEYHFHLLRHSCFTSLLESGTDLRVIQKLAGHNSSKTTEIYTHVSTQLLSRINLPI